MPIKVACQCGQSFNAPDHFAGKRAKCPKCGQPIQIPGSAAGAPAAKPAGAPKPAATKAAAPAKAAAPRPATNETDPLAGAGGGFDLGLGGDFASLLDEAGLNAPKAGMTRCPSCGEVLPEKAVLCVKCGFNRQTGQQVATTAPVKRTKGGGHDDHSGAVASMLRFAEEEIAKNPGQDTTNLDEGTGWKAYVFTIFVPVFFAMATALIWFWSEPLKLGFNLLLSSLTSGDFILISFACLTVLYGVLALGGWLFISLIALEHHPVHGITSLVAALLAWVVILFTPLKERPDIAIWVLMGSAYHSIYGIWRFQECSLAMFLYFGSTWLALLTYFGLVAIFAPSIGAGALIAPCVIVLPSYFVAFWGGLVATRKAFELEESPLQGFLCWIVPLYPTIFGFTRKEKEEKKIYLLPATLHAAGFAGLLLSGILFLAIGMSSGYPNLREQIEKRIPKDTSTGQLAPQLPSGGLSTSNGLTPLT